jgi:hypothetical protein
MPKIKNSYKRTKNIDAPKCQVIRKEQNRPMRLQHGADRDLTAHFELFLKPRTSFQNVKITSLKIAFFFLY